MSLLHNLFNRKRQPQRNEEPGEKNDLEELEEELEDEDADMETDDRDGAGPETFDEEVEYEVVEREIQPAKIICPDCGGITLEGLEFCDKCGGELL